MLHHYCCVHMQLYTPKFMRRSHTPPLDTRSREAVTKRLDSVPVADPPISQDFRAVNTQSVIHPLIGADCSRHRYFRQQSRM